MVTKYAYTQMPTDTFEKLGTNAGMLVDEFDPETRVIGKQLGATSGGVKVDCTPTFKDKGDGIDNCPKNMAELKDIESWECKMSGTYVTIDADSVAFLLATAKKSGKKITPGARLNITDFKDLWYICDYGEGGFIAVHMLRALSTGGLSIQTADKDKTQFAFEFTGHSSMDDQDTVPMEFYVDGSAPDGENGGEEEAA